MTITVRSDTEIRASLDVAIQASANGRHLVRHVARDEPFFYLGDTAWHLFQRLSDEEVGYYLRNRAAKGYNAVMAVLVPEHGAFELSNREDQFPFHFTHGADGKRAPDIMRPNDQYFAFVDRVCLMAAELGITMVLVPTWGRWVNGGLHGPPVIFDVDNAYAYAKYLGDRYPFHPFVLGGDSNRWWNVNAIDTVNTADDLSGIKPVDFGAVTEAMARGLMEGESARVAKLRPELRRAAEGYETFITYHSTQGWLPNTPEASGSAQFPDANWLSLDVVQSGHSDEQHPTMPNRRVDMWHARSSYIPIRAMYENKRPDGIPRPVMDLEPHYENAHYWFTASEPYWVADDIRRGGWQAVFAGACGYTYGCNSVWQMNNLQSPKYPPVDTAAMSGFVGKENWHEELDLPGAFQVGVMRQICLSLPTYLTRVPDSSFIVSDTHEPSDGSRAGDKLIQGMKGDGWAMVHLPYGGEVHLDLSKTLDLGGVGWKAWWIDPRTGGREVIRSGRSHEALVGMTAPNTPCTDSDWLLLVETVSGSGRWFEKAI